MTPDLLGFVRVLSGAGVDYIIVGGGGFDQLKPDADVVEHEGYQCLVVSLRTLIALKRAAGRGKDREALAELEALIEERDRMEGAGS